MPMPASSIGRDAPGPDIGERIDEPAPSGS